MRWGRSGQATVEYAVLLATFVAMVFALAAIWHASASGTLAGVASEASSHSMSDPVSLAKDLSLY